MELPLTLAACHDAAVYWVSLLRAEIEY